MNQHGPSFRMIWRCEKEKAQNRITNNEQCSNTTGTNKRITTDSQGHTGKSRPTKLTYISYFPT